MTWMTDAKMLWTCTNGFWAEPSANLLVKKILKLNVGFAAEKAVSGSRETMLEALELEQQQPGAGQAFMAQKEKQIKQSAFVHEINTSGKLLQQAVQRKNDMLKEFKTDRHKDKQSYLNDCGICAGYTLLWLGHAMDGLPDRKPEQTLAADAQGYLIARRMLDKERGRFLPASVAARDSAESFRKVLKNLAGWKTTVTESARGKWNDWKKPGLPGQVAYGTRVLVERAGANKVWAALLLALQNGKGALLSISFAGHGEALVGHAIGFYQKNAGASIHAFDANFGLGLYQAQASMPHALQKLQECYKIGSTHGWVVYQVDVDNAALYFVPREDPF